MRLIDADALPSRALEEKRFVFTMHDRIKNEYIVETVYKDLADFINEAPTIDAMPVVRCRECRFRGNPMNCPMCHEEDYYDEDDGFDYIVRDETVDEGYCQKGEREEDNE